MPPYKCAKGCRNSFGTRKTHQAKWECQYEKEFDPARVSLRRVGNPRGTHAESGAAPPDGEPRSVPPSSSSAPSGSGGALTFADTVATTVRRADVEAVVSTDWVLDEEHNETFWGTILSIIGRVVHFTDQLLEIEPMPDALFRVNEADRNLLRGAPRRLASSILKRAGNQTLQQAQDSVDSFGGLALFGTLFVNIGVHYIRGFRHSPVLMRRREAAKNAPPGEKRPAFSLFRRRPAPAPTVTVNVPGGMETAPAPVVETTAEEVAQG